jgi:hypothetical protein
MRKLKYTKETIYHGTKEYEDFKTEMGIGSEEELIKLMAAEILKDVEHGRSKRKM